MAGTAKNTLQLWSKELKIDLIRHAYPMLVPVQTIDGIRMASLADLAAMKLGAIAGRGSRKDFYDFYELLKDSLLSELIVHFHRKYGDSSTLGLLRSLTWFDDAETEPMPICLGSAPSWDEGHLYLFPFGYIRLQMRIAASKW